MIAWRKLAALVVWLAPLAALAESPHEAARKAVEASVARQGAAVAAMRISVEKQRAALRAALGAGCAPMPEAELGPLIQQAARQEGLEESLLRAVVDQESGFRACAVSPKGAMGLMHLMPATALELGVRDPFDPQENLFSGARFLKQLLTRFGGDAALALGAYNAGPGRVEENGGVDGDPGDRPLRAGDIGQAAPALTSANFRADAR